MDHNHSNRTTGSPAAMRRRRRWLSPGRLAAWLSFGGAVLTQAALLAGGYFLSEDAEPDALRNAAIAGALIPIGLAVTVLARRAGRRAQLRTAGSGPARLHLVPTPDRRTEEDRARPAA